MFWYNMVKTHGHTAYPLIYLLVVLALVLLVVNAIVERVFSAKKKKLRLISVI